MAKKKAVQTYEKSSAIDPEVVMKQERLDKLFRSRALAAIQDNVALRLAAGKLAQEKLNLELQVFRLQEKQAELEQQVAAMKPEGVMF